MLAFADFIATLIPTKKKYFAGVAPKTIRSELKSIRTKQTRSRKCEPPRRSLGVLSQACTCGINSYKSLSWPIDQNIAETAAREHARVDFPVVLSRNVDLQRAGRLSAAAGGMAV